MIIKILELLAKIIVFTSLLAGAVSFAKGGEGAGAVILDDAAGEVAGEKCLKTSDVLTTGEPEYCTFSAFMKHQITQDSQIEGKDALLNPILKKAFGFEIEGKRIVGLAVGETSDKNHGKGAEAIEAIYMSMCKPMPERLETDKPEYCTWHFNDQSATAAAVFHHHPLADPHSFENAEKISKAIEAQFSDWNQCLDKSDCLIMGCHGQQHRGPTAFMDFLVTKGCSPEHAEDIVCRIWGMNGVDHKTRLWVANHAAETLKPHTNSITKQTMLTNK